MKNLTLIFLLVLTVSSCNKDDALDLESYPQKWQLVEMTGQLPDSVTTGNEMSWQEWYLLKRDGTFVKCREQNGVVIEGAGNFSFKVVSDGKDIILNYYKENIIIGNCGSELQERLALKTDTKMIGTWWTCDGPGLVYERIE